VTIAPRQDILQITPEDIGVSTERSSPSSGEKLNRSDVKYEIVRMLLDNMSYAEICSTLKLVFKLDCAETTVMGFKRNYFALYKDIVEKWDRSRHQYIVARVTEEMKAASRKMVQEVHEIERLKGIVDDRIKKLRHDEDKQTAAYEGVLKDYVRTAAQLSQRLSTITGSTGVEEKLKEMVKRTAMAAQKTLHPYVQSDRKDEVFKLFDQELEEILLSIESGSALAE